MRKILSEAGDALLITSLALGFLSGLAVLVNARKNTSVDPHAGQTDLKFDQYCYLDSFGTEQCWSTFSACQQFKKASPCYKK